MRKLLISMLVLTAVPASAQSQAVPSAPAAQDWSARMAQMTARDRLDEPAAELAAWKDFAAAVAADPTTSPELRARAKLGLAISSFYATDSIQGLAAAEAALEIATKNGLTEARFMPELYAYLSLLNGDRTKREQAKLYAAQSMALARKLFGEESAELGLAQNVTAVIAWNDGDYDEAVRLLGQAVRLSVDHLPPSNSMIVNNIASYSGMLALAGRFEEALEQSRRAVDWQQKHLRPDHAITSLTLSNLGRLLVFTGRNAEAEPILRRAVDLGLRQMGQKNVRTLAALANLANALQPLGKREEAEALLIQSAEGTLALGIGRDPGGGPRTLLRAAGVALERGSPERALAIRERAVKLLEELVDDDHVDLARARMDVANSYRLAGRTQEAVALAQKALPGVRKAYAADHPDRLEAEIVNAQIALRTGDAAGAYALARPIATILEQRLLDSATSRRELVQLGPKFSTGFAAFAEIALASGKADEAFRAAQLSGLSELAITDSDVAARAAIADPEAARLARLLQDAALKGYALKQALSRAAATGQDPAAIEGEIARNDTRLRQVEAELDHAFPTYRALSRPRPVALASFQASLAGDQALILPLALDDGILTLAVGTKRLDWGKSASTGHSVRAMVERLRGELERKDFDRQTAHDLYRAIFPERVRKAVAAKPVLLFPASGPLASLPPALLVTSADRLKDRSQNGWRRTAWLVRGKSIAILPSFAPDRVTARGTTSRSGLVGIGAPLLAPTATTAPRLASLFRGGGLDLAELKQLPSLPDAERELRAIRAALPRGKAVLLTGARATEPELRALDLSNLSVLAFATHGLVSGELNGVHEPSLVLTPPASITHGNDGLLTASEIAGLEIGADWVILSACNTASGSATGAPSYSGLARAFVHAGARSLLLSHWSVRDDAAARLTVDTVKKAAGGTSRAQSLRQAMLSLIDDRRVPDGAHPAVWAPFVLIGG